MSFNNASDGISGSGGSVAGVLGSAGSLAGLASNVGAMSPSAAGVVNQAARAVQLAQTASSLIGKTPAAVADAINTLASKPVLTQQNRFMSIRTPLGPDVLLVTALVADEYLNQLSEIHLDLISQKRDIQIDSLVGQVVSVSLTAERSGVLSALPAKGNAAAERYFHGFVVSFSRVGNSGTVTRYEMTVVPWLWFLTRSTDCRIFQDKTPGDILTEIFSEFGFTDFELNLQGTYKPFEYMVMYRESYFNFVARLMEQEGIIWWVRHEKDRHVLVITDSNAGFGAIGDPTEIPFTRTVPLARRTAYRNGTRRSVSASAKSPIAISTIARRLRRSFMSRCRPRCEIRTFRTPRDTNIIRYTITARTVNVTRVSQWKRKRRKRIISMERRTFRSLPQA